MTRARAFTGALLVAMPAQAGPVTFSKQEGAKVGKKAVGYICYPKQACGGSTSSGPTP